jgi:glycosyltransferase involved in cell wall biosynthesis
MPAVKSRLRILYISPCWPHGESFGSQLRALQICRSLKELGELSLAVVDYSPGDARTVARTAAEFNVLAHGTYVQQASLPERFHRWVSPRAAAPEGFVVKKELGEAVLPRLGEFDLIWLHHLRTANAFPVWRWPNSVMDIDDVPSTYYGSVFRSPGPWGSRLRAGLRMVLWRRRERCLPERFDALAVCSEADRGYLAGTVPVHVIPNGFLRPEVEPERHLSNPPRIGFIGRFAYPPNLEGMHWFANTCWPLIKQQIPSARLRIVGRESDGPLKPPGPDIDGLGWVEDATPEIATWSAMIVPIRTGAGTRVKMAEAFSRKCPVIATRLGAFGYNVKHGAELLMADEPEEFAAACVRLVRSPKEGATLAEAAWQRFLNEWTWEAIGPRVWAAAKDGMKSSCLV